MGIHLDLEIHSEQEVVVSELVQHQVHRLHPVANEKSSLDSNSYHTVQLSTTVTTYGNGVAGKNGRITTFSLSHTPDV